jgi:hypothetical protein
MAQHHIAEELHLQILQRKMCFRQKLSKDCNSHPIVNILSQKSYALDFIKNLKLVNSYHVTNMLTSLPSRYWFMAAVPHLACSVRNLILRTDNHAHPGTVMH